MSPTGREILPAGTAAICGAAVGSRRLALRGTIGLTVTSRTAEPALSAGAPVATFDADAGALVLAVRSGLTGTALAQRGCFPLRSADVSIVVGSGTTAPRRPPPTPPLSSTTYSPHAP